MGCEVNSSMMMMIDDDDDDSWTQTSGLNQIALT
jgi:hypothetical protein